MKIKKCKFFTTTVEYLGHIIKPGRLEIDQVNKQSLRQAKPPTTKSELRAFLGLCNVYTRFIDNFTNVATPLNFLLKKNSPDKFELDEDQVESFRSLIDTIRSSHRQSWRYPSRTYHIRWTRMRPPMESAAHCFKPMKMEQGNQLDFGQDRSLNRNKTIQQQNESAWP